MIVNLVVIGLGIFVALAGLLNWEWFLDYQARRLFSFESMIGRAGTRIMFMILGVILVVIAITRM